MARKRSAVSGPGAGSKRTDLAPGGGQPIRVASGQPYGERSRLVAQQQAQPLTSGSPGPSAPVPPGAGFPAGSSDPGIFGPTQRPGEPITEGAPVGPGSNGPMSGEDMDIDRLLQVIYSIVPSAAVARLMNSR